MPGFQFYGYGGRMKKIISVLVVLFLVARNDLDDDLWSYRRPESVDTPPLLSLPRDKWPEHGLDAVERGLIWGQCGVCGFPVTIEDIENGSGDIIWMGGGRLPWGEFSCYRHVGGSS